MKLIYVLNNSILSVYGSTIIFTIVLTFVPKEKYDFIIRVFHALKPKISSNGIAKIIKELIELLKEQRKSEEKRNKRKEDHME